MLANVEESTAQDPGAPARPVGGTPRKVVVAVSAGISLLLAGAFYLILVRGEALILDLSKLGQVFCF